MHLDYRKNSKWCNYRESSWTYNCCEEYLFTWYIFLFLFYFSTFLAHCFLFDFFFLPYFISNCCCQPLAYLITEHLEKAITSSAVPFYVKIYMSFDIPNVKTFMLKRLSFNKVPDHHLFSAEHLGFFSYSLTRIPPKMQLILSGSGCMVFPPLTIVRVNFSESIALYYGHFWQIRKNRRSMK